MANDYTRAYGNWCYQIAISLLKRICGCRKYHAVGCRWLALLFIIRGRKTFFVNSFLLRDGNVREGRTRVWRMFTSISKINVNNNSGLYSSYMSERIPRSTLSSFLVVGRIVDDAHVVHTMMFVNKTRYYSTKTATCTHHTHAVNKP